MFERLSLGASGGWRRNGFEEEVGAGVEDGEVDWERGAIGSGTQDDVGVDGVFEKAVDEVRKLVM